MIHNNNTNNNYDWYTTTIYQLKYSRWNINNCGAGTFGQEKRYMHINVHTLTHIYMRGGRGVMRENIYIYIRWFITNLQETPWVDAKRNKVLLVSSADRPCWCGRNIVWNMESYQSFWITSSEHQGTMPKRIFSFSCSMQVIQFADLQFHLIK